MQLQQHAASEVLCLGTVAHVQARLDCIKITNQLEIFAWELT